MSSVYTCLWFDHNAEEAASFYVSLVPDSRIDAIYRSPADNPSTKEGEVLLVDFTLGGHRLQGLNGGPEFPFSEAASIVVECEDQSEVDRLWAALTTGGGEPGPCGWLKDRFGLSWQVIPRRLLELTQDTNNPAGAERAMQAMLQMGKIDVAELERAYSAA